MTKSDPYHNSYTCPSCEEDVPCALPLAKYVECPECKTKLEIMVDAEFDGQWHDLTELDFAKQDQPPMVCKRCGALTPPVDSWARERGTLCQDCRDYKDREHKQRMIDFSKGKQ